ncbi:hypothetical protein LDENG_00026500 [Lucifuga dentata]|nr:hypothetical protein LDENG_00026500 [Lucifuga dentata]
MVLALLRYYLADLLTRVTALPQAATGPLHSIQPGDWVLIKAPSKRYWHSPKWLGPFLVLLITETAVKMTGRATWVHATHCKKVSDPATCVQPGADPSPSSSSA